MNRDRPCRNDPRQASLFATLRTDPEPPRPVNVDTTTGELLD